MTAAIPPCPDCGAELALTTVLVAAQHWPALVCQAGCGYRALAKFQPADPEARGNGGRLHPPYEGQLRVGRRYRIQETGSVFTCLGSPTAGPVSLLWDFAKAPTTRTWEMLDGLKLWELPEARGVTP